MGARSISGDPAFVEIPAWVELLCGSPAYRARAIVLLDTEVVRCEAGPALEGSIESLFEVPGVVPPLDDLW